jgi:hypothetical protein
MFVLHRLSAQRTVPVLPCLVVHRTATVRCLVCTGQALLTVRCAHNSFLKIFSLSEPEVGSFHPRSHLSSISILLSAISLSPPAITGGVLQRRSSNPCFPSLPLVSTSSSSLSLFFHSNEKQSAHSSHLLKISQKPYEICES